VTAIEVFGDATQGDEWTSVAQGAARIVDAHAAGLERALAGLTLLEAAKVTGEPLAVEALASALGQIFTAAPEPGRAVVAMSGGVDSAVALLRAGSNAIGVTLRLWQDPSAPDTERACCSPAAVAAARSTCHSLGIPHVTLDLREEFRRAVVEPFAAGYEAGSTPNPCIRCNGAFRFDELLAFMSRAGAETLWTGHYARIVEHRGKLLVACATDARKDRLTCCDAGAERVARVRFPLGEQRRRDTRKPRLPGWRRLTVREPGGVFSGGGDYCDFLEREGLTTETGAILDTSGNVLGRHGGYWKYTSGQRRGLGVSASRPLYVLRTEPSSNSVVVGEKEDLTVTRVDVEGALYVAVARGEAKLRYGSPSIRATVSSENGGFSLQLEEPAYAVARGQVAVVYDEGVVVGAGVITDVA
jgi:tRNA-specific 2-thiouridylase